MNSLYRKDKKTTIKRNAYFACEKIKFYKSTFYCEKYIKNEEKKLYNASILTVKRRGDIFK